MHAECRDRQIRRDRLVLSDSGREDRLPAEKNLNLRSRQRVTAVSDVIRRVRRCASLLTRARERSCSTHTEWLSLCWSLKTFEGNLHFQPIHLRG